MTTLLTSAFQQLKVVYDCIDLGSRVLFVVFFWGLGPQLQRMNSSLSIQLLSKECIDHSMAGSLHLRFECVGDDVEPAESHRQQDDLESYDTRTDLKCVSLEVLPVMA